VIATRILWTGASFVPEELTDLVTWMINEGPTGMKVESVNKHVGGTPFEKHIKKHGLSACVLYSVCTGKSPVGDATYKTFEPEVRRRGSEPLDDETSALLQKAAWETFQEWLKRDDISVCLAADE
jgi:hypothetical protein